MKYPLNVLPSLFYQRDPEIVARNLLGKILIRRVEEGILEGVIVETEAYYGLKDPASRAYHGKKRYNRWMWGMPGTIFIYNVHNNWMFNISAHKQGEIGAVLIRALEPLKGIEIMKAHREVENIYQLVSGPGKLSKALAIDKNLNGILVTSFKNGIAIVDNHIKFEVKTSHRIGVSHDLKRELRFFIKGNKFVSR